MSVTCSRSVTGCSAAPSPRSVADYVVVDAPGHIGKGGDVHRTPDGLDDRVAATLSIAGCTAAAALAVVDPGPSDTLLVGGAGGGVGVFAVQLARLAGARVIGTGSAASADALRALGAEPVTYGEGPGRPTPRTGPGRHHRGHRPAWHGHDRCGTRARRTGLPHDHDRGRRGRRQARERRQRRPRRHRADRPSGREGRLHVPIAATFPVDEVRAAVALQAGRHVHGKVVIDLKGSAT